MENRYQKWVNASYLLAAALTGYVIYVLGSRIGGIYDLESKVKSIDIVLRVSSVTVALAVFLGFYRNRAANQFMSEVADEIGRVTWPSERDTSTSTFVVIVMVLLSGMLLGFMDYLWTLVMKWIL